MKSHVPSHVKFQAQPVGEEKKFNVTFLTLNRPDEANAFSREMIVQIKEGLEKLKPDKTCRALIIKGAGKHFSAGADLEWMRAAAKLKFEENLAEAKLLAEMFDALYRFPLPTIAVVKGAAYGGAVGLIACCDIVIASDDARFSLSEVKLGLLPAVILPHLAKRMLPGSLRRLSMTARVFDAGTAKSSGLVDIVSEKSELHVALHDELALVLSASPDGQRMLKELHQQLIEPSLAKGDAPERAIAKARTSSFGQAGMSAFLEKKSPPWAISLAAGWHLDEL